MIDINERLTFTNKQIAYLKNNGFIGNNFNRNKSNFFESKKFGKMKATIELFLGSTKFNWAYGFEILPKEDLHVKNYNDVGLGHVLNRLVDRITGDQSFLPFLYRTTKSRTFFGMTDARIPAKNSSSRLDGFYSYSGDHLPDDVLTGYVIDLHNLTVFITSDIIRTYDKNLKDISGLKQVTKSIKPVAYSRKLRR